MGTSCFRKRVVKFICRFKIETLVLSVTFKVGSLFSTREIVVTENPVCFAKSRIVAMLFSPIHFLFAHNCRKTDQNRTSGVTCIWIECYSYVHSFVYFNTLIINTLFYFSKKNLKRLPVFAWRYSLRFFENFCKIKVIVVADCVCNLLDGAAVVF